MALVTEDEDMIVVVISSACVGASFSIGNVTSHALVSTCWSSRDFLFGLALHFQVAFPVLAPESLVGAAVFFVKKALVNFLSC